MNKRRLNKAITHQEALRLKTAKHEAARRRNPLNMFLTLHPDRMIDPPADVGLFARSVIRKLGQWFRNHRHHWWSLWVRENYDGQGREHLHLLIHVPHRLLAKFRKAVARWWPEKRTADLQEVVDADDVLDYMLKQMTPQAAYALRFRVGRETHSRHDLAKVAAVLGNRVGMTRNLDQIVRRLKHPPTARVKSLRPSQPSVSR